MESVLLNSGRNMPIFGLGTWQSAKGVVGATIKKAIELGYRHFDCAAIYGNEVEIGQVFSDIFATNTVKRDQLFITSKLWNSEHRNVKAACMKTINELKVEYLDLYLIHWPFATKPGSSEVDMVPLHETWAQMEQLVDDGLVKSIGVSNWTGSLIMDMLSYARIKPAVNQIELHPHHPHTKLVEWCTKQGIVTTAYSPLGHPGWSKDGGVAPLTDPTICSIAERVGASPAQVILKWIMSRGIVVIPKSVREERLIENMKSCELDLSEADLAAISSIGVHKPVIDPYEIFGLPVME